MFRVILGTIIMIVGVVFTLLDIGSLDWYVILAGFAFWELIASWLLVSGFKANKNSKNKIGEK